MSSLRITYKKSTIGYSHDQKATVRSLGLRKLNQVVVHPDSPSLRGMLFKVRHLVTFEEISDAEAAAQTAAPDADSLS
jgi:large subunit ribosomal protein L30